jgi:Zn-dependent protease with chaperone function
VNFFDHQQLARRNTRAMVVLFALAVVAVIAAVDLAVASLYLVHQSGSGDVPLTLHALIAVLTGGLIFGVSLFRIRQLSAGGPAVAGMIGAREVHPHTRDALERRLLNVVEEMAIASGARVPAVYVMDAEQGINAFAAGWDVSGAVLAVTRGALEGLTRDELQGVVAHEFSHILNGDMRLNLRMIGVLAGIVFIGASGRYLLNSLRSGRRKGQAALLGVTLLAVGFIGVFFARLIKAAVSRQREFLADASGVQFTRNPAAVAGALDQIRSYPAGSLIAARRAEDMSHMFFVPAVGAWLGSLFGSHPPLEDRIRRVHPGFDASAYRHERRAAAAQPMATAARAPTGTGHQGRRSADVVAPWGRSASESASLVGMLSAAKMDYAARMLAALPVPLREALREPGGASAAMVALLLATKEEVMQRQLHALAAQGYAALAERARALMIHASGLDLALRLPVVDLALPALRNAPQAAKTELLGALEAVIYADRRVSLHEFVIVTLVRNRLAERAGVPSSGKSLARLRGEAATLLSLIAHAGTRADATGERYAALESALRAGEQQMGFAQATPAAVPGLDAARAALEALEALAPMEKQMLVKGLFAAATADGNIRVAEAELLRLVCAVLDCPLPPFVDEI